MTSHISAAALGCPRLSSARGCSQVPLPLIKGFSTQERRRPLFSHPVARNAEYGPFSQDAECPASSSLANKQPPPAMRPKVNELLLQQRCSQGGGKRSSGAHASHPGTLILRAETPEIPMETPDQPSQSLPPLYATSKELCRVFSGSWLGFDGRSLSTRGLEQQTSFC